MWPSEVLAAGGGAGVSGVAVAGAAGEEGAGAGTDAQAWQNSVLIRVTCIGVCVLCTVIRM